MATTPPTDPGQGHLVAGLVARAILAAGDSDAITRITAEAIHAHVVDRVVGALAQVAADHLPDEGVATMAANHLDALAGKGPAR